MITVEDEEDPALKYKSRGVTAIVRASWVVAEVESLEIPDSIRRRGTGGWATL
jgi:hypothetical protein